MTRALTAVSLLLLLGACASLDAKMGSYSLGRGLVTYDDMRRAKEKCAEVGGVVRPKDVGGDMAQLSNYICEIQPKKADKP
ncbi:MAG: hypothetical protein HY859_03225 [Caulobacterales bacterium]|nr:hypothetical protein [Caulobacterales bacterium]